MVCHYCGRDAEFVTGKVIYPNRPDVFGKRFYLCRHCEAYVGCHFGTNKPLGILANAELRAAKRQAHYYFDMIWMPNKNRRSDAYRWLASVLKIPDAECHIGMFDLATCYRVAQICEKKLCSI